MNFQPVGPTSNNDIFTLLRATRDACLIHMFLHSNHNRSVHNQNPMRVEFSTVRNWIGSIYTVKISLLLVDVSSWLQMVASIVYASLYIDTQQKTLF